MAVVVVAPFKPGVIVLNELESIVILIGLRVTVSSILPFVG
jgi:hypothetical protein